MSCNLLCARLTRTTGIKLKEAVRDGWVSNIAQLHASNDCGRKLVHQEYPGKVLYIHTNVMVAYVTNTMTIVTMAALLVYYI